MENDDLVLKAYVDMCAAVYAHRLPGEDEVVCVRRLASELNAARSEIARLQYLLGLGREP